MHDYITQRGGAERVVLSLSRAFPGAPIYTTMHAPSSTYPEFRDTNVVTSPIDRLPPLRRHYRAALPLLPWAISQLRIDADVVIASSSGWAHGVETTGRKLVYCHAPARWLYQSEAYLGQQEHRRSVKNLGLNLLKGHLLRWDSRAALTADAYVANSTVVSERIKAAYGIDAQVIHPPFGLAPGPHEVPVPELRDWAERGYHLIVSRLLPYKNVGPTLEAFAGTERRLVVVGNGPMWAALSAGLPANVRMVRDLSDEHLRWVYRHALALLAPSFEDFGLTPLEGATFGVPTIALRGGGYLDTVIEGVTGAFFDEPTPAHIRAAVDAVAARSWDVYAITKHAAQFGEISFSRQMRAAVDRLLGTAPDPSEPAPVHRAWPVTAEDPVSPVVRVDQAGRSPRAEAK